MIFQNELPGTNYYKQLTRILFSFCNSLVLHTFQIFCNLILKSHSEYPFKENKHTLKNIQVLLYTQFYNFCLNVLRPNFLIICNLPISHFSNIRKIRVKVGPKTNYFSYFMNFCTNRIVVFKKIFSLILSQPADKQNCARDFFLFKYFLNNLLLTAFMQNTFSKLVELLQ